MKIKAPWNKYLAEFLGTGILLMLDLSLVIFMFGEKSPASEVIPSVKLRQIMTGFLFGCVGASIAQSPPGKVSGAHVNPVVTVVSGLSGKIDLKTFLDYIFAHFKGAVAGKCVIYTKNLKSINKNLNLYEKSYCGCIISSGLCLTIQPEKI